MYRQTLPSSLSKLHLLRELQLGHNQFSMQEIGQLASVLVGKLSMRTLDLSMSSEVADLARTVVFPSPPLNCRVGEASLCQLRLFTRTSEGLSLPHGGLEVTVERPDHSSAGKCQDEMDGTYACVLPPEWFTSQSVFDFLLMADGAEIAPTRQLDDPATGQVATVNAYVRMGIVVEPIRCQAQHSAPNADGSACVCNQGYHLHAADGGSISCERCPHGQQPVDGGMRCELCSFGLYSSTGIECLRCSAGEEPNLQTGAYSCQRCGENSISLSGSSCQTCDPGQVADQSRTRCVCPQDMYNTSLTDHSLLQCIPHDLRRQSTELVPAVATCASCAGLDCISCDNGLVVPRQGWSRTNNDAGSSSLVFGCPFPDACVNDAAMKCAPGTSGVLCGVCSPRFGRSGNKCLECSQSSTGPSLLAIVGVACCLWVLGRWVASRNLADSADPLQVGLSTTENPLQFNATSGAGQHRSGGRLSLSDHARVTAKRSSGLYLLLRVVFQSARILISFLQVVTQIGPVLQVDFPPRIDALIGMLKPFMLDVQSLLQLDCLIQSSYYGLFLMKVFVLPAAMIGLVSLRYLYELKTQEDDGVLTPRGSGTSQAAAGNFRARIFFVVFLIYPQICNQVFGVFSCRHLDGGVQVLLVDYSVDCGTSLHGLYQLIAGIVVIVFSFGLPLYMVQEMVRRTSEYGSRVEGDRFIARRVADECQVEDRVAAEAISDVTIGQNVSFLVNAFSPRFFYWEGLDMVLTTRTTTPSPHHSVQFVGFGFLGGFPSSHQHELMTPSHIVPVQVRKLLLVGMLAIAGRGSVEQLFLAICISCGSFALQLQCAPVSFQSHRSQPVQEWC